MKKYLIWSQGHALCYPRLWDGSEKWCNNSEPYRHDWWLGSGVSIGELEFILKNGRFVTLDHEPTPAEVRTLLEGPDPLSECLDAIRMVVLKQGFDFAGTMRSLRFSGKEVDALEALLEKYREGGK